jgi:GrpB-like predicted nucleotidyltransferase (UPF0157 family)
MSTRVHFVNEAQVRAKAEQAFERHRERITRLLPFADVQHVGSSAIPGSITKGDLDIQVRVPAGMFEASERALAELYARNTESSRTEEFSSFKDDNEDPPLGIQLTAIGSEFDDFIRFRDLIASNAEHLEAYNRMKASCEGLEMDEYRRQKDEFIDALLNPKGGRTP